MIELSTIAIDPGVRGGFCHFIGHQVVCAWKFTSMSDFTDDVLELIQDKDHPVVFALEDVPPFAGKNIPSSAGFKLGKSCGFYEGLARGLGLPCHMIPPKTWQKGLANLKGNTSKRKRVLKDHATRLYPDISKEITLNTADAVLIGHFFVNQKNK